MRESALETLVFARASHIVDGMHSPGSPPASVLRLELPVADPHEQVVARGDIAVDACDYCGSARLEWRKCKLICAACQQINKSCADL